MAAPEKGREKAALPKRKPAKKARAKPQRKKVALEKHKPDPKGAPAKAKAATAAREEAPRAGEGKPLPEPLQPKGGLSAEEALAVLADIERKEPERIAAAERLGALKHTAAIDAMFAAREASEAYLARAISAALRAMGAGAIVAQGLQSGDAKERERAAARLLRLGDPSTEAAMLAGLRDPEQRVRRTLVEALAKSDTAAAKAAVDAALRDRSPDVRAVAAGIVGKRGGPEAAAKLRAMLEGEHDDVVREFVERALVKLGAR